MRTRGRFWTIALAAAAVAAICGEARTARGALVYLSAADGYGRPLAFETLDTVTGALNVISTSAPKLIGMEFVNGQFYGEGYNDGHLYLVNPSTGATSDLGAISASGSGDGGNSFVSGPNGPVYMFNSYSNTVYTLNPPSTTATATNLPIFASTNTTGLIAMGPNGLIYGVDYYASGGPTLKILNPTTGVVTAGPTLSRTFDDYSRLFFDGSSLYAVGGSGLYAINTTTGNVTTTLSFSSNIGQVWAAAEMPAATAAPEPSSLALRAIAGVTLALVSRRPARAS